MSRFLMIVLAFSFFLQAGTGVTAAVAQSQKKAAVSISSASLTPVRGGMINNNKPVISAEYLDEGIGVSAADTKLFIDGQDVSTSAQVAANKITYVPSAPLADGLHQVKLNVVDRAGNASDVQWSFSIHTQPPQIKITSHKPNQFVNKSPVLIAGTINDPRARILVNGISAMVERNTFSARVNLVEGSNTVTAVATDNFGNSGNDSVALIVDTKPPMVEITAPGSNSLINTRLVTVTGITDKNAASVTVTTRSGAEGVPAIVNNGTFSAKDVKLEEGQNTISVKAVSQAGNVATAAVRVTVDSIPPKLTITNPRDMTVTNKKMISVTGTVDKPSAMVRVNTTPVQAARGMFSLSNLSLAEGNNSITATAVDRSGNLAAPVTITVVVDTTGPTPPVLNPMPPVTRTTPVTVTGSSEPGARIELFVNSATQVSTKADEKGAFSLKINLTEGNNAISAVAYDGPGNASAPSTVLNVFLDTRPPRIL